VLVQEVTKLRQPGSPPWPCDDEAAAAVVIGADDGAGGAENAASATATRLEGWGPGRTAPLLGE
jgi:hypothetical protein